MAVMNWTFEPALSAQQEFSGSMKYAAEQGIPEAMYAELMGKPSDYLVSIYDGAEIDAELSERDGRTRYRNVTMIAVKLKDEKDYVSEVLTDKHKRRFPAAVRRWEDMKNRPPRVSNMLLPGIDAATLRELEELQLIWADQLIAAQVPDNLKPWQDMAKRLQTLSKPRMRLVDGRMEEVA